MRLGVISDVHGNLAALEAVLAELDAQGVDRIVCCGDVVGYGPWPNECVEAVRARARYVVCGNHDAGACDKIDLSCFNGAALAALRWTHEQLRPEAWEFLKGLPARVSLEGALLTHASPRDPVWEYILDRATAAANFHHLQEGINLCLFGHSHVPTLFVEEEGEVWGGWVREPGEIRLDAGSKAKARYLINPGSVGQPRDGDRRAAYAVMEWEPEGRRCVRFCRVEYDIERTCSRMEAAGLPERLYNRLWVGR